MKKSYKETITIQSVRGITASKQRVEKKHNINTETKPHIKLRQVLVHPKDQKELTVIREIQSKSRRNTFPLIQGKGSTKINLRRQQEDTDNQTKRRSGAAEPQVSNIAK